MDDARMSRIYAVENATQRGDSGTARTGSVASALRILAKAVMTGHVSIILETCNEKARSIITGLFEKQGEIGAPLILKVLHDVPGITTYSIQKSLDTLKASGHYTRIVSEVKDQVDQENKEALARLKQAEIEQAKAEKAARAAEERERKAEEARKEAAAQAKAAREEREKKQAELETKRAELERKRAEEEAKLAKKREEEAAKAMEEFNSLRKTKEVAEGAVEESSKHERVFDYEGVVKYLDNNYQIEVFKELVLGPGIKPYISVNQQATLAKELKSRFEELRQEAKKNKKTIEFTGQFIRDNITSLLLGAKTTERKISRDEDRKKLEQADWSQKYKSALNDFTLHLRGMLKAGTLLNSLSKKRPSGAAVPAIGSDFRNGLRALITMAETMLDRS
jgi:chemotaxis protein histidine kinase CheA